MIYAGADLFLMPSISEPCGLSQIIAMRFGTIPVVRETGGLKDTVTPYNKFTGEGRGFTFSNIKEFCQLIQYYQLDRTVLINNTFCIIKKAKYP